MDETLLKGLSEHSSPSERAQTLEYFETLNSLPTGWKICATHFNEIQDSSEHIQFFCLRVIERHVRNQYACSCDESIISLRAILIQWMQGQTVWKLLVLKKMAQIIALAFITDYPQRWPQFFSDILKCINYELKGSVELYMRVLMAIDEEVVDRQIIHTHEENVRNTLIKDTMRDQCVIDLVESWYQIMERFKDSFPELTNLCMEVIGAYISWIDISLIANEKFVTCLMSYLAVVALRESAAECLREVINKGMEPTPKMQLVEGLADQLRHCNILSTAFDEDGNEDYRVRLSSLMCTIGCSLVTCWNKFSKQGDYENIQLAQAAIDGKLPYLFKYLSDVDDGVSEAMIPFAVQYMNILKHLPTRSESDRANLTALLKIVINKYKYDEGYNFMSQGEEEVEFLDFRKELKVIIDNIAILDAGLMLETFQGFLSACLSNLQVNSFVEVEVALRMMYLAGEAISDKKFGACNVVGSPWHQMMNILIQSKVSLHVHTAVLLQFYENIVRYEKYFTVESQHIPNVMKIFLGGQGLRHSSCSVRSRVCYLFVRFVKGLKNHIGPIAKDILLSLQELLVVPQVSDMNRSYLSGNDMMFLYEAAGYLVVATPFPSEGKGDLMAQLLRSLVEMFPLYLQELPKTEKPSDQEVLVHHLSNLLSFASRASKVFTNHQMTVQNGCLQCFSDPLPVFLKGLEVRVHSSLLQSGVRQYLHRMIICLGDELLKYIPMAVSLLLTDCKSQDIQEFIPLINQLITKYKERISPFLQTVFMPVVQTIATCLNQPFDHCDQEALRDNRRLQKSYFLFLNSLATNNVTEVIAKGSTNLEEVLGSLVQGAVSFPDPTVQKLCFGVLRRLIEVWAREDIMPGFVDYMYGNILPACFISPLKPTFDLNDGNTFLVLGEIACIIHAILNTRGREAVVYIQGTYLPSIHMSPPAIEEFLRYFSDNEPRQLRQYLEGIFRQLQEMQQQQL